MAEWILVAAAGVGCAWLGGPSALGHVGAVCYYVGIFGIVANG